MTAAPGSLSLSNVCAPHTRSHAGSILPGPYTRCTIGSMSDAELYVRQWALEVASCESRRGVAVKHRDEGIRLMRSEGASFRRIAEAAGLSFAAIQKIVKKGELQ